MQHPFDLVSTARRVSIAFTVVLLSTLALAAVAATPTAAASSVTITFHYNGTTGADGTPQHWSVPPSVRSIAVDVYGAEGGAEPLVSPFGPLAGLGGHVHATLAVTPGQVLTINVGGHGAPIGVPCGPFGFCLCQQPGGHFIDLGGYNGGGQGGDGFCPGGGGGGASDIRSGTGALQDRIIVAGGGGGGANSCSESSGHGSCGNGGSGGGDTGGSGTSGGGASIPGGGGTQTTGGSAAVGSEGRFGIGGLGTAGAPPFGTAGGGGGGGWYGGGGGGATPTPGAAGAGGGSGHVAATATGVAMMSGARVSDGLVSITYVPLPVPTTINQCFHGAWKNVVDTQGHPFKNQGLCVAFVVHHQHGT